MDDRASGTPSRGEAIEAMIEIPRGARNKYEYDEKRGSKRLSLPNFFVDLIANHSVVFLQPLRVR